MHHGDTERVGSKSPQTILSTTHRGEKGNKKKGPGPIVGLIDPHPASRRDAVHHPESTVGGWRSQRLDRRLRHHPSARGRPNQLAHRQTPRRTRSSYLVQSVILERHGQREQRCTDADGDHQEEVHRLLVCSIDRPPFERAGREGAGHGQTPVDVHGPILRLVRQVSPKLRGDVGRPDRSRDGRTHRSTGFEKSQEDGRRSRHFLVARRGLDPELRRQGQHAAADPHGDLRADDLFGRAMLGPISNQEANGQQIDADPADHKVLVMRRPSDHDRRHHRRDRRRERKHLGDPSGLHHTVVPHHLKV